MYLDVPEGSIILEPKAVEALRDAMLRSGHRGIAGPGRSSPVYDFVEHMEHFAKVLHETQGVDFEVWT